MYFGAVVGGSQHLWRQAYPNGSPEQITFGATEEEGIAMAPDGNARAVVVERISLARVTAVSRAAPEAARACTTRTRAWVRRWR